MVKQDFPLMLLLVQDANAPNVQSAAGWTPLIAVTSAGDENAARTLLSLPGIDVNRPENDGWTPLMFAANNNRVEITRMLLLAGANRDARSLQGLGAVGIARDRGFNEVSALLKTVKALEKGSGGEAPVGGGIAAPDSSTQYQKKSTTKLSEVRREEKEVPAAVAVDSTARFPEKKKSGWLW
jgi:ankyrin repeat protein